MELIEASFRGIAFEVKSSDAKGGRRGPVHQFALRDDAEAQDLGLLNKTFTIEGFIANDEAAADRLIAALDAPGPGEYQDPWRGRILVFCTGYEERRRADELGLTRFQITFERVTDASLHHPRPTPDAQAQARAALDNAEIAVITDFEREYDLKRQPGFVWDEALAEWRAWGHAAQAALGFADAAILDLIAGLIDPPRAALGAGVGLAQSAITIMNALGLRARDVADQMVARPISTPLAQPATPARRHAAFLSAVIRETAQRSAVIATSRAALDTRPPHATAAMQLRDDLARRFDGAMEGASDDLFARLCDAKAAMVRDLTARAVQLPRLRAVAAPMPMPALVLAHRLYGDDPARLIDRTQDFIARNPTITHPGLVPAGESFEALE